MQVHGSHGEGGVRCCSGGVQTSGCSEDLKEYPLYRDQGRVIVDWHQNIFFETADCMNIINYGNVRRAHHIVAVKLATPKAARETNSHLFFKSAIVVVCSICCWPYFTLLGTCTADAPKECRWRGGIVYVCVCVWVTEQICQTSVCLSLPSVLSSWATVQMLFCTMQMYVHA